MQISLVAIRDKHALIAELGGATAIEHNTVELAAGNRPRGNVQIFFDGTAEGDKSVGVVGHNQIHILVDDISHQRGSTGSRTGKIPSIVLTAIVHGSRASSAPSHI